MARYRFLRIASRHDRVIRYREVWATDRTGLTPDQDAALDLGCTIQTPDGIVTDLIAYFESSEAERNTRALELVS